MPSQGTPGRASGGDMLNAPLGNIDVHVRASHADLEGIDDTWRWRVLETQESACVLCVAPGHGQDGAVAEKRVSGT